MLELPLLLDKLIALRREAEKLQYRTSDALHALPFPRGFGKFLAKKVRTNPEEVGGPYDGGLWDVVTRSIEEVKTEDGGREVKILMNSADINDRIELIEGMMVAMQSRKAMPALDCDHGFCAHNSLANALQSIPPNRLPKKFREVKRKLKKLFSRSRDFLDDSGITDWNAVSRYADEIVGRPGAVPQLR